MSNRIHSLWLTTAVLAACSSVQELGALEGDAVQSDSPPAETRTASPSEVEGEAEKANVTHQDATSPGDQVQSQNVASTLMPVHSPEQPIYTEPNRERYEAAELNPIHRVVETPVSTFSIDVDTASYSNMRRFLGQGVLPPEDSIRVEELLNYFDYHYEGPGNSDHPFAIHTRHRR
jgi:Ca-activated chloride channel family protein